MTDTPEDDDPSEPPRPVHSGPVIAIETEMKSSYLDYAMSVIVSRAIPDLRDGLKPVHRRILYAMHETGNTHDKAYRKSARPVGDVMGKYHPHGDSAIYDALVRMAQTFSMSLPLLDGQGNFGSMDGDPPAAMRYTEVRLDKPAAYLLADIDKETVDFQPNYDGKDIEPTVLPARFPNMLVNGAAGIAVGMATNIPPHNLGEVIDATLALIENPELTVADLMEFIPAPDFPTGALILGRSGARKAYHEGRGSVIIRSRTRIEEVRGGRLAIIVSEIPYQVNKATMIERIAELARDKQDRGHRPRPGRERPLRRPRRRRAPPRRHPGRGAEPALPLHAAADQLRLQHAGAERRPPRAARPQALPHRLHRLPRGGGRPPHRLRAAPGPRARPHPLRPRGRGHQRRRGGGDDPLLRRPGRGARAADDPRLARRGHRALHLADRRPDRTGSWRTAPTSSPRPRPAPSSSCGCSG